jgi:hypothetical protein
LKNSSNVTNFLYKVVFDIEKIEKEMGMWMQKGRDLGMGGDRESGSERQRLWN